MRKFATISSIFVLVGTLIAGLFITQDKQVDLSFEYEAPAHQGPGKYKEWLNEIKKNPVTGEISLEDVVNARFQVKEARQNSSSRDLGLEWEDLGPSNVGGRTRAIMISKSNPNRMYAGSVSGGLFLSDNGGLSWYPHPQNPMFETTLISTISEAANGDIYFGTGEGYTNFFDGTFSATHGFTGNGVYKSSDGGATFSLLSATEPTPGTVGSGPTANWAYVNRVACHPTDANTVLAATTRGMYYSTDGGTSWAQASRDGSTMTSVADDCLFTSDGVAHIIYIDAYARNDGSDVSTFSTSSWGANLPGPTFISRAVLGVTDADPNYVYIYAADNTEALLGVYQSTDGGANFNSITPGSSTDLFNPPGTQGTWDLCIGVNPADPERVYIGGQVDAWTWSPSTGWNTMAASFFGQSSPRYIHADHHDIKFHPTNPNIMYFGTDGGVFRTLNALDDIPDFSDLNKGYSTFQAHGVAGGLQGESMGGSQDNGTSYQDFSLNELKQGRRVLGGDGAGAEISKIRPEFLFAAFFDFGNGGGALRRSANDGGSFTSMFDQNIDNDQNGVADGGAAFVETDYLWEDFDKFHIFGAVLDGEMVEWPIGSGTMVSEGDVVTYNGASLTLDRDNLVDSRFFLGTNSQGLWMTPYVLQNSTEGAPDWFRIGAVTANVTAVTASFDGDHAYFGTTGGDIYRVSGLNNGIFEYIDYDGDPATDPQWFADSSGITLTRIYDWSGYITGIDVSADNPNEVVITRGGYGASDNVQRCTNATTATDNAANFTSLSASLPNIPVFDCAVNYYNSDEILLATEFGVWSYDVSNPGGGWTQETSILGNVPVFEIRQDVMRAPGCYPIYIGTHGRGFFRAVNHVDPALGCDFELRDDATALEDPIQEEIIAGLALSPNPTTSSSRLTLQLNEGTVTKISVYDLTGKRVLEVARENLPAGTHNYQIETAGMPVGTYLVAIETAAGIKSTKLIVTK